MAVPKLLHGVVDAIVAVLFPAPCRVCERPLTTASRIPVCRECLESLRPLSGAGCQRCGRPIVSGWSSDVARPLCHACRRGLYAFDLARSWGGYDETMVRVVTLLKYEAIAPLGNWFGARLAECVSREPIIGRIDVVVPVPLHPARLRERGYNQAELIARPLARRLSLPLASHLLARIKPRPDKLKLTRRERWEAVRGAYVLSGDKRVDKLRILLVDDVFTSGATLDACAKALRSGGAAGVIGLTVARATAQIVARPITAEPVRAVGT